MFKKYKTILQFQIKLNKQIKNIKNIQKKMNNLIQIHFQALQAVNTTKENRMFKNNKPRKVKFNRKKVKLMIMMKVKMNKLKKVMTQAAMIVHPKKNQQFLKKC